MAEIAGETDRLEIKIDRSACRGSGECALRAGRTFALDDEDRATLLTATPGATAPGPDADSDQIVLAAARSCPTFAISVTRSGVQLV